MSSLMVELDPALPARLLWLIGELAGRFPGEDRIVLMIGERRLSIPNVENCPELRASVLAMIDAT